VIALIAVPVVTIARRRCTVNTPTAQLAVTNTDGSA
jgi:hypothetical protein